MIMASTGVVLEFTFEGIGLNIVMLHVSMKKVHSVDILMFI